MSPSHRPRKPTCALDALTVLIAGGAVTAQLPDEFTNLELLPKDIGKRELMDIMRGFSQALGVRCKFCHVGENPNSLEGYDFASDEPKHKRVARVMMKTTHKINTELLPMMGKENFLQVRCVTCHRGVKEPEALDDILLETAREDDVETAAKRYRELREKYYGMGAYDFGPGTLNAVAESLATRHDDVDGAIELVKLNLEFDAGASASHLLLGQLYSMKGDKASAISSIERAIELDPDNGWAKQMLNRVRSSE